MMRTELKRKTPMPRGKALTRASEPARLEVKLPKCAACRNQFVRLRPKQKACSPECAQQVAQDKRLKDERRQHKAALQDCKPLSHWLDLTQRAVNAMVKARDQGRPCISCGATQAFEWDAGHYLSRGARPELRFHPDNIALQCAACNRHKGGNQALFRLGLVARIGLASVEDLEGPHPPAKFTRETLAEIRKQAQAQTRQLKKASR